MVPIYKLYLVIALLASLVACQPGAEKPSAIDLMMQTESTLTAGMETLKTAIDIGRVDINSDEYAKVYAGLEKANEFMDTAWAAYRAGNLEDADSIRRIALSSYMTIRPLLVELAGESP